MATNPPAGDGHRNGAVRKRSQVYNPKTEQWVKGIKIPDVSWMSNKMVRRLKVYEKKSDLMRTSIILALILFYTTFYIGFIIDSTKAISSLLR